MPTRSSSATASRSAALALFALLATQPAHALLRFNDGRDQVYVTAYVGAGYDSNVFARADSDGDVTFTGGAGVEYARKAGLIGVNASLGWHFGSFSTLSSEDFLNPYASLEFAKGSGRTTGSVQFNLQRESRPDPTVGLRTESWNYGVNLNLRYPVIERYSIAGNLGWSRLDYVDSGTLFSDLDTYTVGTDLFYSWRSDRDLFTGYRYRQSDAQFRSSSVDHSVYVGVSGRIVSKLSGSARVGWTQRTTSYPGSIPDETNDGLYASVSSTWPVTRKAAFTLTLSEDFNVTSTNFQTRNSSADLVGRFSHTAKFSSHASLGVGRTEFISGYANNATGPTTGFNGVDRTDYYLTAGLGASYVFNNHFTLSANYGYYHNWSDFSASEFARHSVGITLSTRW